MVMALHNTSKDMNHYCQQLVRHDMHDRGREEKGAASKLLDMMSRSWGALRMPVELDSLRLKYVVGHEDCMA